MKAILNDAVMLRFIRDDASEWYRYSYKGEFDKIIFKKQQLKR